MRNQPRLLASERMSEADVQEIVRSALREHCVPFTSIAVTSSPSAWKVIVYDQAGMIFRLPVLAGPRRWVRQAVLEAIETEW